jgi:hypothetical protein
MVRTVDVPQNISAGALKTPEADTGVVAGEDAA